MTASNDQEAASAPSGSAAAQQHHAEGSAGDKGQQVPAGATAQPQTVAMHQQAGTNSTAVGTEGVAADRSSRQDAAASQIDGGAPGGADDHFVVSSPRFDDDDDPANPDGKLMSLLMG